MNKLLSFSLGVYFTITLFPGNAEAAPRCQNPGLTITYSIPELIEINSIDDIKERKFTFQPTAITGRCRNRVANTPLHIVDTIQGIKLPGSKDSCNKDYTYSPKSIYPNHIFAVVNNYQTCGVIPIAVDNTGVIGWATPSISQVTSELGDTLRGEFVFNNYPKKPGITYADTNFIFPSKQFYSIQGQDFSTLERETVNISIPDRIKIIYRASCSASVNDVDFGRQKSTEIFNNKIAPKQIKIQLECQPLTPHYTVSLIPENGVHETLKGVIKTADNDTVGYKLTWADNTLQQANNAVEFNRVLMPTSIPEVEKTIIPIDIHPVALVNRMDQIKSGAATTTITIKLTYN